MDNSSHQHSLHQGHDGYEIHDHPKHGHAGEHHYMMVEEFKKKLWISMAFIVTILSLSPMIQKFFGFEWVFPGNSYVLFILTSILFFNGG